MQYARTYKIAAFYLIFILFLSGNASAASVTNLDSKSHVIVVEGKEITIEANSTWRASGKAQITYQGREISMLETDELSIWNDHEIGPQKTSSTRPSMMNRSAYR